MGVPVLRLCLSLLLVLSLSGAQLAAQTGEGVFRDFSSAALSRTDKRFLQTALAFEGHYNGMLDGDWGPMSQRAIESFAAEETESGPQDWHMAALALAYLELEERDGWNILYLPALNLSLLHPFDSTVEDPPSRTLANWHHRYSSLSYSAGRHSLAEAQALHDFTLESHVSGEEPYVLRRRDLAISTARQSGGRILYTRSAFTDGGWSTVMLSARTADEAILNAVAGSIGVGRAASIFVERGGALDRSIRETFAFLESEAARTSDPAPERAPSPSPSTPVSSGTGFVVAWGGEVLTNQHVVADCDVLTYDGLPANVLKTSVDLDLALLQVEGLDVRQVARFSPLPARLNSDVTVVGYPLSGYLSGLNVTRGSVSSQLGFGGAVTGMQITAPVQPGNSGGPVLASNGEVVGVVVSKLDAQAVAEQVGDIPQNVNFAIRGEIAKLFLFQHGVDPQLGGSDDPLPPEELAELASSFTGQIECHR